jgi:hypothetical protein
MFSLKNDAFNGYFPSKNFISQAIQNKSFPWWNPYINFGIPQYGDMDSGFWSPFTWLIALTVKYNSYSFTIELLFYLFISGIGMYQLCRSFTLTKTVSYLSGFAFMCSGYMVGHLQHFNWISGAAFIPWCLWGYNKLINKFSLKNNIVCSLLFYLFLSSAHPGLIIGGIYFFTAYILFFYFNKKSVEGESFSAISFLKKNGWMFGLLLILSLGLISGYSDIIPHMTRGKRLEDIASIINPFSLQSIISLLLPLSIVKADAFFRTDISMRSAYFGLTLFVFFIYGLLNKKTAHQKFFLYTALFFLLISLGGIINYLTYNLLPLIGYVRLSGEFMIFSIISVILFGALSIDKYIIDKTNYDNKFSKIFFSLKIVHYLFIGIGVLGIIISKNSFFLNLNSIIGGSGIVGKLKILIDTISFFDILFLQSLIQLGVLTAVKNNVKSRTYKNLIILSAIEIGFACLLNVPFTGVGQSSVSEVQSLLNRAPDGLNPPFLIPIYRIYTKTEDRFDKILGDRSFYDKQIGVTSKAFYPVELNTTQNIFKDSLSLFCYKPFIFSTNDSAYSKLEINYFKNNFIELTVESRQKDTIVYQQNLYPNWKCMFNGDYVKPIIYAGVFNAIAINPGKNFIKFIFKPGSVSSAMDISKYVFLLCLLYLIIMYIKRSSP